MNLQSDVESFLKPDLCLDSATFQLFTEKLAAGKLTREEDPVIHFGTFILPIDKETNKVLLVLHKKAGMWIPAGGHLDPGENGQENVARESGEELGLKLELDEVQGPFFLSSFELTDPKRSCRRHFDLWYYLLIQQDRIKVDMTEFDDYDWFSLAEARQKATHPIVFEALDRLQKILNDARS